MATLAAMAALVIELTVRPDLVNETNNAVKAATLKAHQSDFFFRDLVAGNFAFANPALSVQQFNAASLTRWRAWSYLQDWNPIASPVTPANGRIFAVVSPDNLFDQYQIAKTDTAWQVGMTVNLRSSAALPTLYYAYYQNQDITDANNLGWISDNHPWAIVYEAARIIFKSIGYDEQTALYKELVADQYVELKMSNIQAVGS